MKVKFCQLVMTLALGVLLCMPGIANADWTSVDQGWYDNYPDNNTPPVPVNQLDFYIVSGSATFDTSTPLASFGSPGFSGWTVKSYSPTYVVATNPSAPTSATWEYIFSGSGPVANYNLVWYAYYNGQFQMNEIDTVTNGQVLGLSIGGYYFYTYTPPPDPIPLPPSALLLGSGILGLAMLRWQKKGPA